MKFKQFIENQVTSQLLHQLKPQLVRAAQTVYNQWNQNEDGFDDHYGAGGICHDIADAFCEVLYKHNIECTSFSAQIGEQHVWAIAKTDDGVYSVDIPPSYYETGAAYTWKKIPNVIFTPDFIHIDMITPDPQEFDQYADYY